MGIETATYVTDLVAANPGSSDLRSQGDDHLRLIKQVLQNSLPTLSKAWYNPSAASKVADYTVLAADMNKTFLIDTSGGVVNLTLPTLVSGDAGWECFVIKTNTGTSPVLVKPPSGTLSSGAVTGLSAARRCIPNVRISCFWTGTGFIISRSTNVPIGCCIDLHVSTLPVGFEWPTGQTLASASTNYPEFNSINGSGVTLDVRGRYTVALDNLGGSAASRITTAGGGVDGATMGAVGGGQNITILTANLPAYTPAGTISNGAITINNGGNVSSNSVSTGSFAGGGFGYALNSSITASQATTTFAGTPQGGTSTAVKILPPTIMITKVLVVE